MKNIKAVISMCGVPLEEGRAIVIMTDQQLDELNAKILNSMTLKPISDPSRCKLAPGAPTEPIIIINL